MSEQTRLFKITLDASEMSALAQIAHLECRSAREQLRYLVRKEAQSRGLLNVGDHRTPKEIHETA